jgi:hypothetical protein
VPCADSIGTTSVPAGYRVVVNDVAVPSGEVLQPVGLGGRGAERMFAKWGLLVRVGAVVQLRVAPGWDDRARIGWGQPGIPATSVQVEACTAGSGSAQWSVFAGGAWVARPACVPLLIWSRGQQASVGLPIGVACERAGVR